MPELRKDPITDRWVIISTERENRPSDFLTVVEEQKNQLSPFAPGNEDMTPPEIFAIRTNNSAPNMPGWSLRVIPNKYPALKGEGQLNRRKKGFYDSMNGIGAHEVVIETPDSHKSLVEMKVSEIQDVFRIFKERIIDLKKDIRLKYALVFKNWGPLAGATLKHSHSQLIATPIIPKRITEEIKGAKSYYDAKKRCIFCDIIQQEVRDNTRIVYDEDCFVAIAPFAARSPFETWILPKQHDSHFENSGDTLLKHLSITTKVVLQKLNITLQTPPYNFVIHTAPMQDDRLEHYHWHIEILPRLTNIAGFEWGTDFYINPTSPEDAAAYLRKVNI